MEGSARSTSNDSRGATEQSGLSQLVNIFPDLQRDVIVATLQRRWVIAVFLDIMTHDCSNSANVEGAVDAP
jgi:hypothetical protein